MKRKKSLFLPLFSVWLAALVAVAVYAVARYFALSSGEGFSREALFRVLWESLPALIATLALGAAALVWRLIFLKDVRGVNALSSGISQRVEKGENVPAFSAHGKLGELSERLCSEEAELKALFAAQTRSAAEEGRAQGLLCAARDLQEGFCSDSVDFGGLTFDVGGRVVRADLSGSDLIEAFELDADHVFLAVGDVWGRGFPAALFMARLSVALKEGLSFGMPLSELLGYVNEKLYTGAQNTLAASLFCGVFNVQTGELRYANAGHFPPVVAGENAGFLRVRAGVPLGVYADARFFEEMFVLRPGQGLLLYTEGAVYAEKEGVSGQDGLLSAARRDFGTAMRAKDVADDVLSGKDNVKDGQREDDAAALVLRFSTGRQQLLRPESEEAEKMRLLLEERLQDDPRKDLILRACEEIFLNIVRHAGAQTIRVSCEREEGKIVIRFTDDGTPFDPLRPGGGDLYSYVEEGAGFPLVRSVSGEIFYRTKQQKNVLTLQFPAPKGDENG